MGIKAVMCFVLKSVYSDKFLLLTLLPLTFVARLAGRQLNSFLAPIALSGFLGMLIL